MERLVAKEWEKLWYIWMELEMDSFEDSSLRFAAVCRENQRKCADMQVRLETGW